MNLLSRSILFDIVRPRMGEFFYMTTVSNITSVSAACTANQQAASKVGADVSTPVAKSAQPIAVESSKTVTIPQAKIVATQYYNDAGSVIVQVPSATVVAYLEQGLSSSGLPLQSTTA